MTQWSPGEKLVIKSAPPGSHKGIVFAPYVNLFLKRPGVTRACANLALAAAEAADRGIRGRGAVADYVRAKLTGVQVRPAYWQEAAARRQAKHASVAQRAQAWRQIADRLEAGRGGRAPVAPSGPSAPSYPQL